MNPLFRIDFSISDSLKIVRKSVLIYETIINSALWDCGSWDICPERVPVPGPFYERDGLPVCEFYYFSDCKAGGLCLQ